MQAPLATLSCFHEPCEPDRNSLPSAAYFSKVGQAFNRTRNRDRVRLESLTYRPFMLLDFEVQRCTRCCAATERALEPGDECYSVLEVSGADVVRKDYCSAAWKGAPENAFGWWKSRVPEPTAKKIKLAPNDVLLELFEKLAEQIDQQDLRYVLALLLVRRRVLRVDVADEPRHADSSDVPSDYGMEAMTLYCTKRDTTYQVATAMPAGERIDEIQQQLSQLLIAGAE